MSTVAFIGLGGMGSLMAAHLQAAGHALRVYNRDHTKTKPLADMGAEVCDSPASAAQCAQFVCLMVADDAAMRAVMLGPQGVMNHAAQGTIIVGCGTNTPALARELARAAAARGLSYLDAPVLGSLAQARARELVFLVGGEGAAIEQVKPILCAMGKMARRIGESGSGAALKLINNMLLAALTGALAEAAVVAEAAGLDPAAALEALGEGSVGSRALKTKLPKMFARDFSPQFALELMNKDLSYFAELARDLDCAVPIATLVLRRFADAQRDGLGKLDFGAVFLQAAAGPLR